MYPQQPSYYGQGVPYPPQGYPPAPAPSKRNAVIWSLVAVGVVIVIALASVLVYRLFFKDEVATFELDRGINVEVTVPDGWHARLVDDDGPRYVLLLPDGDDRRDAELQQALERLLAGRSADPLHMVIVGTGRCPSDQSDLGKLETDTAKEAHVASRMYVIPASGGDCAILDGRDIDSHEPDTSAADLARGMDNDGAVVATRDRSRPSTDPSY